MKRPDEQSFLKDVEKHEMRVLLQCGLYRHLLFAQPGNGNMWFEIITWPNKLTISGDMGTWVFSRVEDMFNFFRSAELRIKPNYWGEKLQNGVFGGSSEANLLLVKGGVATSYSKVTEGEKLRLKVATVLAMIEVAEKRGVGRHPGLLMIDSPAAQEVSPDDLDELVAGLQSVSNSISHIQVFVAGRTSAAITEHVPEKNRREALDGGFLW